MGSLDFDVVFDCLDPSALGFISLDKLQEFHEVLHFTPISSRQVEAAVSRVCGENGVVNRQNFLNVLQELDRRRTIEERAAWDFKALDNNADGRIPLKDALLLLRDTHGDDFTMATWDYFMASRDSASDEVCFDELRMLLCNPPMEEDAATFVITDKERELEEQRQNNAWEEYDSAKHWQETTISEEKEKRDYQDSVLSQAQRKYNKWEREGLESLLFDDGKDADGKVVSKSREKIILKDLFDQLEEKYSLLRQKLTWEMVLSNSDELMSAGASDNIAEVYRSADNLVKELWRTQKLEEKWEELPGSINHSESSLQQLMGELANDDARHKAEMSSRYDSLVKKGKSPSQANQALNEEYQEGTKGKQTFGGLMCDLHSRYQGEKEALSVTIKSWLPQKDATHQICRHYFRLRIQALMIGEENRFAGTGYVCGLGERTQVYRSKSYDWDRVRAEKLAFIKLAETKGRQPRKHLAIPTEGSNIKKNVLKLQEEIIHQLVENFTVEREMLMNFLQGVESSKSKSTARGLTNEKRHGRVNSLRSQRQAVRDQMAAETAESLQTQHTNILLEATGLCYETMFEETIKSAPNVTEDAVNSQILADLVQKQYTVMDSLLYEFVSLEYKDLKKILKDLKQAYSNDFLDNVAFVLLGTLDLTEEERCYVDALDLKYKVIRETVLLHALKKQHGSVWKTMVKADRQRELRERKKEEKRQRAEGRFADMAALLGTIAKEMLPLRTLLGEDKGEYSTRVSQDKVEADNLPSQNPLADLVVRQEAEQTYLLAWLRSPEVKAMTHARRRAWLVRLLLERLCVEQEGDYDSMGYRLGLVERVDAALTRRHAADCRRQEKLAALRCKARRQRLVQNKTFQKEPVPEEKPVSGDIIAWQMIYINQVIQRHLEEGEQLMQLCQDDTLGELQEAAQTMDNDDKQKRLGELYNKRRQLDLEKSDHQEESLSILEEAAAIKTLCRKAALENRAGDRPDVGKSGITVDDVAASLMYDLITEQDRELAAILHNIVTKEEADLRKLFSNEVNARRWEMVENVITVLTRFEGDTTDDKLLQELDEKYDSLRDKLLAEALMRQIGEAEWQRLSERERQRRLAELKLQERKLRKEGKFDELSRLLGDQELIDKNLRDLLGASRAESDRRLQERLANRRRRQENGENVSDDESDMDDTKQSDTGNVLGDLNRRYEEERDALMARLQGRHAQYLGERERQAELLRLRRERRQAEREGRFEEAAIALGLIERNSQLQDNFVTRQKSDRERRDQLLRARLDAIRQGKVKRSGENPPEVVKQGDRVDLQDAVLRLLEHRHGYEEERLVAMLSNQLVDLRSEVSLKSELEREDLLAMVKTKLQEVPQGRSKERQELLNRGVTVKSSSRAVTLAHTVDGAEASHDDVCLSLMADLRTVQNEEAEKIINDVTTMNEAQLISLQEEILASEKNDQLDSVVAVVFRPEGQSDASEGDFLSALEGKYDALKDKLFVEALMKQAGEANWMNLSEKERQKRLFEMKLKERKLRQENKLDELGKLLGEDLQNREALSKIMADTEEDQRRKAQEKLEKRRQRLAQGLSEEKCDELEKAEEEEELNKPRNVLLELQHRYEQEKAELLRQLKDSSGKLSTEKERQQALMRLKLQQRRVRKEDRFDSAALVLGLARENQQTVERNLELERERQLILARERLAARKNRKNQVEEDDVELSCLGDTNSEVMLQGAVTNEITARHQSERDYLMQLFEACDQDSVQSLSESDMSEKFSRLQQQYTALRQSNSKDQKALQDIFQAALVVQLRRKQTQSEDQGGDNSLGGLQAAILAGLQQIQDEEFATLMSVMADKDMESLKYMKAVQSQKRKESSPDNLAVVLLDQSVKPSQTDSSDEVLMQALSDKYDALKERLFAEAAIQKKGDNWWDSASEEDKQAEIDAIRQEDRTLRDQGKGEEADAILEGLLGATGMKELLGEHSEESDEERTAQREKLRQERLEAGMSLDEVLRLEEADNKGILSRLSHDYEAERAALLAMLKGQQDRLAEERSRQLALAKLRRDQHRLKQEANVDGALLLFEMANTQKDKLQQNLDAERSRQRALAEERLAARRNGQRPLVEGNVQAMEDKLKEQQLTNSSDNGAVSITSILGSLELKHEEEREMLYQLYTAVTEDTSLLDNVHLKSAQDILGDQKSLKEQRDDWLRKMQQSHADQPGDSNDTEHLRQVATARAQQFPLLKTALALKLEVSRRLDENSDNNDLEKVKVTLLTDLQTLQNTETESVQAALLTQVDESVLGRAERLERRACREGWYLTLADVLLLTGEEDQGRLYQQDRQTAINNSAAQGLSEAETEALLKQLDEQHKALLQRTKSERELHEREVKRKLLERKQSQRFKADTEDEALNILLMSGAQAKQAEDATMSEKNRQNSLMQERLAARREARKVAREEKQSDDGSRPSSQESKMSSGSKTPVRISVDSADAEKQASQLIGQQTYYNRKISEEQARQAEKLRRRLEQNPSRRKEEAVAVLSLGERQKSVLEKSKQEEYARQKTSVQERVAQVRYEKTMTMRERSRSPASRSPFGGQITEEEEGKATDDKMKMTAQKIESKLKQEEQNQTDDPSDGLMTDKSRLDRLKQRRAEKKQKRLTFAEVPE